MTEPESPRPALIPPPGEHGGDGARIAAVLGIEPDEVLDLSASLNPFAPDVAELASRHLGSLRRYPDVARAERVAAELVGVKPELMVLTAGGSQAIALVARCQGTGWVDEPEFSLYRRHLDRLQPEAPRWRSDPHSPTGRLAPDLDDVLGSSDCGNHPDGRNQRPSRVTVWDEAFLPLSAGVWTRHRPGWALGSFTKAFACPGLRLGYVIAPDQDLAAELRRQRPLWAVGGIACSLLPELAAHADPPGWTERIAKARYAMCDVLRARGWDPLPSDAPWVLVPRASGLREALAPHAVVVRDCSSFGLPDHVRIAVPDDSGLERLDRALSLLPEQASRPS